ncbi:hypothetical protein [Sphingomonas colocasiae]|uniref:Uncharacterized protein n=1 Tax=Sphingomonas colocasiae TaxID=1848973 RepID=A0ABS7PMW5_9SPHN|nr:hypothetical protein [Sphingomonas colocasiae]MBY8822334.1 hypothetical protein [Sphingomonas colocasiae]
MRILEPASSAERSDALRVAANEPDIFRSILDRFDGRIPKSDEPVRAYLIRDMGFSKGGAEDCLSSLRKTIECINALEDDVSRSIVEAEAEILGSAQSEPILKRDGVNKSSRSYRIPLTRDCEVELDFHGAVTERAISRLIMHIELMKEVWAEED